MSEQIPAVHGRFRRKSFFPIDTHRVLSALFTVTFMIQARLTQILINQQASVLQFELDGWYLGGSHHAITDISAHSWTSRVPRWQLLVDEYLLANFQLAQGVRIPPSASRGHEPVFAHVVPRPVLVINLADIDVVVTGRRLSVCGSRRDFAAHGSSPHFRFDTRNHKHAVLSIKLLHSSYRHPRCLAGRYCNSTIGSVKKKVT